MSTGLRSRVAALLASAGIELDGNAPWDMRVHDRRFYTRVLLHGSLGLGESYMDGWWDADDLDGLLTRLLAGRLDERFTTVNGMLLWLGAVMTNMQRRQRAWTVGRRHYDLGNDLFEAMLGKRLVYSCGYWNSADSLDQAQEDKLHLVCRKLGLRDGMRVLDIGCGWGEALKFAAEHYGVHGVGVTISHEQASFARELCKGLPIEIRAQDYRELHESFDRIWSIGMFEHVGLKNYRSYFETVRRNLADGGWTLLHTIGSPESARHTDPWIARYIFPNSMVPSAAQITRASEGLFSIDDWHGFGGDYDRTLLAWRNNFDAAWQQLSADYDVRFQRMWHFYLAVAAASFRSARNQLWQLVLSPHGMVDYQPPR